MTPKGASPARKSVGILARETEDGKMFLFNTTTNELFRVNSTGGRVWEMLGDNLSTEQMAETISKEFDGAEVQTVRQAIGRFLAELLDRRLITQ